MVKRGAGGRLRRLWYSDDAFSEHRLRTVLVSVVVAFLSVAGLAWGPDPSNRHGMAVATALATALSLALITLIYELLLRQSHAQALQRFVKLDAAVVAAGLVTISEESDVGWPDLFRESENISFVLVSPYRAVSYLSDLLKSARGRLVHIKFCFPDLPPSENDDFEDAQHMSPLTSVLAKGSGADHRLAESILSTVDDLVAAFSRESRHLRSGSSFQVVVHKDPVFMEGVLLDRVTVIMPFEANGRPRGSRPSCFVFEEGRLPEVIRFREALQAIVDKSSDIENKVVGR